ncbi:unnamed protein product, partial [Amoebophrya sp. A25]
HHGQTVIKDKHTLAATLGNGSGFRLPQEGDELASPPRGVKCFFPPQGGSRTSRSTTKIVETRGHGLRRDFSQTLQRFGQGSGIRVGTPGSGGGLNFAFTTRSSRQSTRG